MEHEHASQATEVSATEGLGFWTEREGDRWLHGRVQREREARARRVRRAWEKEQLRRAREDLEGQVASAVPVVPDGDLSAVTVSSFRFVPLLRFAPPSTKIHTLLIRMQPRERLCFHGRIRFRVIEGCAHLFGHYYHPSSDYHTLNAPFCAGAYTIGAVQPTQATLGWLEKRKERLAQQRHHQMEPPLYAQHFRRAHGAYQVADKEIRDVLEAKRKAENPEQRWEHETVLVLRSFYEKEHETDVVQPEALSLETMKTLLAPRLFIDNAWEAGPRPQLLLRAPQLEADDSSDSDEPEDAHGDQPQPPRADDEHQPDAAHPPPSEDMQDGGGVASGQVQKQTTGQGPSGQAEPTPTMRPTDIVKVFMHMPGFYPLFPHHDFDSVATVIPTAWSKLRSTLLDDTSSSDREGQISPPRILITGKKGTGKSTISQYLVNSLLNKYPYVAYLDADLGQPEFTPSGLVSLHILSSPVTGPAFTHLSVPLASYFLGETSLVEVEEACTRALRLLVDRYYNSNLPGTDVPLAHLPLVVNTYGWLTGVGYAVLRDLISHIRPAHAVHLYSFAYHPNATNRDVDPSRFPFGEEKIGYLPFIHALPAVSTRRPRLVLVPDELRVLRLNAYFGAWREGGLAAQIPYRVPWNAIRLSFVQADVPPSECLHAFNGSLVGLGADANDYLSCAPPECDMSRGRSDYPSLLLASPVCECVGLGIVRTIDPETHHFYVLTPIPLSQLQRVNTFVKGSMSLPVSILLKAGWLNNPYVMTEAISKAGGVKMAGRTTIMRKHTAPGHVAS